MWLLKRLRSYTFENFNDKTATYQWVNPITSNNESVTITFSGNGVALAKADNDRLNILYNPNLFTSNTITDYSESTYTRVFRHACNNDPVIDNIINAAKQAYPNNVANQFNYCIGFETTGLSYKTDSFNFGTGEYVCLPAITLYNQSGDCEDRAILLGAMMHKAGFDVSLILLYGTGEGHAIVGVVLPAEMEAQTTTGSVHYTYGGKKYYCLEATSFIQINELRPILDKNAYTQVAIIPANTNLPVAVGSIKETLRTKQ